MAGRRAIGALLLLAGCGLAAPATSAGPMPQTRCGWFDNPSPQNASLFDRDGEWVIAQQGGPQARGNWPGPFAAARWVRTGAGSYGYGCACLQVTVDAESGSVREILSSAVKPLAACRRDPALKGSEPFNPLH